MDQGGEEIPNILPSELQHRPGGKMGLRTKRSPNDPLLYCSMVVSVPCAFHAALDGIQSGVCVFHPPCLPPFFPPSILPSSPFLSLPRTPCSSSPCSRSPSPLLHHHQLPHLAVHHSTSTISLHASNPTSMFSSQGQSFAQEKHGKW